MEALRRSHIGVRADSWGWTLGLREADSVVALCDITSSVNRRSVRCGDQGIVLKQSGWHPVTFKVRFTVEETTVILDGVTDRQIERIGGSLGDPYEGRERPGEKRGNATDPQWRARDPFADSRPRSGS